MRCTPPWRSFSKYDEALQDNGAGRALAAQALRILHGQALISQSDQFRDVQYFLLITFLPTYQEQKMTIVLQTQSLSKCYGHVLAVDAVDLHVDRGEVYGFLGLNGAGKTTTIRALLGMIRPSSGSVSLFGAPITPGGDGPWRRVGHLVETPAAYPELTVRENLEVARRLHDVADRGATIRAIDRFGLATYADRPARTLSMGNLQRLGLARALLHDPELVVLDEPANGLDPAGVVEVRELLRALAREQGVTVFMSSHNLAEVDRLATRIGIIHAGRLIEELDMRALERLRARRLAVDARDRVAARAALEAAGYVISLVGEDGLFVLGEPRAVEAPDEVARLLVAAGTPPIRLAVEQDDLEQHFLQLTGGTR
jgi:ABC-2 type transport system ATP-binding protein